MSRLWQPRPVQVPFQPQSRRQPAADTAFIAFDAASNSGYQAAASTYSWTHVCTGNNRYLTVGVAMLSISQTVTGITYNSVALSLLGTKSSITGACRVELWGLVAPAEGSHTIAVTLSGAIASAGVASSYTGVNQVISTEAFNSAQATNVGAADATVDVTTVADNDWCVDIIATDDTSITVGAGQTSRGNVSGAGGSGAMSSEGPQTPAGAVTMSWTGVGALATWAIGSTALRPFAATSTFTASAAVTVGAATCAGAATMVPPTYTATAAVTAKGATCAGVATFTQPVYTATSAVTVGAATATGSATFSPGTHTATAAVTTGAATCAGSATFVKPTYTGTGTATAGPATCEGNATFSPGTHTATAAVTVGAATCAGSATFTKPVFTASTSVTIGAATCAGSATFAPGTHTASAAVTAGAAVCAGSATFTKPTYTATSAVTVGAATARGYNVTPPSSGKRKQIVQTGGPDAEAFNEDSGYVTS